MSDSTTTACARCGLVVEVEIDPAPEIARLTVALDDVAAIVQAQGEIVRLAQLYRTAWRVLDSAISRDEVEAGLNARAVARRDLFAALDATH